MPDIDLSTFSAKHRRLEIDRALDWELQDLAEVLTTAQLVARIAERLNAPGKANAKAIASRLMERAPSVEQAARAATAYSRYGKTMRPWTWNPARGVPATATVHEDVKPAPAGCSLDTAWRLIWLDLIERDRPELAEQISLAYDPRRATDLSDLLGDESEDED